MQVEQPVIFYDAELKPIEVKPSELRARSKELHDFLAMLDEIKEPSEDSSD